MTWAMGGGAQKQEKGTDSFRTEVADSQDSPRTYEWESLAVRGRPPPEQGCAVSWRRPGAGCTGAECPAPGNRVIYIWHLFGLRVGIAFVISSVMLPSEN